MRTCTGFILLGIRSGHRLVWTRWEIYAFGIVLTRRILLHAARDCFVLRGLVRIKLAVWNTGRGFLPDEGMNSIPGSQEGIHCHMPTAVYTLQLSHGQQRLATPPIACRWRELNSDPWEAGRGQCGVTWSIHVSLWSFWLVWPGNVNS